MDASFTLGIEVQEKDALYLLARVRESVNAAHLTEFMRGPVEKWFHDRIDKRFESEGDDVSGKWAPLKERTQQVRFAAGFNPTWPINVRFGDLRDWLLSGGTTIAISGGAQYKLPSDVGTGSEVAQELYTAQFGRAFPATVPRPVLGMDAKDLEAVLTALNEFIVFQIAHV